MSIQPKIHIEFFKDYAEIWSECPACGQTVSRRSIQYDALESFMSAWGEADAQSFLEHLKTHHGATEFKCAVCKQTFTDDTGVTHEEKMAAMHREFGTWSADYLSVCQSCNERVSRWWKRMQQ